MERLPAPAPHPALLPVGTLVGPWRVEAWAGQGAYGAVFRAVRVGQQQAEPVALKVALFPGEPRFPREAQMLARMHHPSIPRLIDAGEWQHPIGTRHPYIAMEWINGVPLYDWAQQHHPTSRQVSLLLAQLARALQALHAQEALHRDFKGDNVLVRRSDSRAMLTDFGSGSYSGAPSLTPQQLPPGTPNYRSPEAWLFQLRFCLSPSALYLAQPADDLYALGVTACRLVTGEYPRLGEPRQEAAGLWQVGSVVPPQALLLDSHVEPHLRAWILRLLSVRPEERRTAQEAAEALERAAEPSPPRGTACTELEHPMREERAGTKGRAVPHRHPAPSRRLWPARAAVVLTLALAMWWLSPGKSRDEPVAQSEATATAQPDTGTVGLGDSAAPASTEDASKLPAPEAMAEDTLPEPQPGQMRPDAKGRCPSKGLVALNERCWLEFSLDSKECEALSGQLIKGTCYVPFIPPKRRPTSSPVDKP